MRGALAAAMAGMALTAAAAQDQARWYVRMDNDLFFGTDRWYSSHMRLGRVQAHGAYELELGLFQEIFTPEVKRYQSGGIDRAPTARLLATVARHDRGPGLFQTLELSLGVRGPSAFGREVTDLIHKVVPAKEIVWSRQEGDRFDAQLAAVRSSEHDRWRLHHGAVLGNEIAFVHGGVELRFGARGASSAVLRHAATPPWSPAQAHGWSGFVGAGVRGIGRNRLVKRPYSAFGEELEPRRAVGRAAAGVGWSRPGLAVSFALVHETREFAAQRTGQEFGSVAVHAEF